MSDKHFSAGRSEVVRNRRQAALFVLDLRKGGRIGVGLRLVIVQEPLTDAGDQGRGQGLLDPSAAAMGADDSPVLLPFSPT